MRALPLLLALVALPAAADDPVAAHVRMNRSTLAGAIKLLDPPAPGGAGHWSVYLIEVAAGWGEITGQITSAAPGTMPRLLVLATDRSEGL